MAKIVIIGAGLTGLSTAYHLEKNGFYDYEIFEKEAETGGLCRSVRQDGFTFDFTGHLLHINDPYFQSFIQDIVGFHNLNQIERRSFIYSCNTYTPYPYQMNLYGLPAPIISDCICGFVARKKSAKKVKTYYQWILKNFGSGFGNHFFFPYQRKIFDYDIRKISSSWTSRFVPSTCLQQIIQGSLAPNPKPNIGYNSKFFYPKKGGINSFVSCLEKKITNKIQKGACLKTVDMKHKKLEFKNGDIQKFDILISTMPLKTLLCSLKEKTTTSLHKAAKKLRCNAVVNFNLGISIPQISDKHWIYFPEEKFPFYRIGFGHNFSTNMAPFGNSCLYGEFAHTHRTKQFVSEKLKQSLIATKQLLNLTKRDIVTEKIISIPYAYVIYDLWREKHIGSIHNLLNENQIYSIGRYGAWKYASMQEAILDGKEMADILTSHTNNSIFLSKKQEKRS